MATIKTPPKLYRWKTDPKGKAPAHTVTFKQHQVNRAPIVPGSSINNKTLKRTTRAAMDVKYGPLQAEQGRGVQRAQSAARDVGGPGGFYDQYLAQLAKHSANVNTIAGQANAAVGALPAQVTGLAGADAGSLQGQANTDAAARGMGPAADITGMASDATAIRQALTGSFAAQQAAQGAAAQTYADTLAHVVGPTEKLAGQAVAQGRVKTAREKVAETKRERGASALQYREDTKASEAKNVLASQIAGVGAAAKAATTTETRRHNKATESNEAARIRAAAIKAGKLSPSEQKTKAELDYFNKHGYWPPTGPPKGGPGSKNPKKPTLTLGQQGEGASQAGSIKGLAEAVKAGNPLNPKNKNSKWVKRPLDRNAGEAKIRAFVGRQVKNPFLVRAAVDAVYDGHLSAYTVQHLKKGGYSPREIAATLGVKTHDDWLKTPAGKAWLKEQGTPLPKPPSGKPAFNPSGSGLGRLPGR